MKWKLRENGKQMGLTEREGKGMKGELKERRLK